MNSEQKIQSIQKITGEKMSNCQFSNGEKRAFEDTKKKRAFEDNFLIRICAVTSITNEAN